MKRILLKLKNFNLKYSYESGQPLSFYADFSNDKLTYVKNNHIINAEQSKNKIILNSDNIDFAKHEFISRFRLNDNMLKIYKEISTDKFMADSINRYNGLRVTLNDPWETLVVFIISQNNNIKRIRTSTIKLIEQFGHNAKFGKSFPSIQDFINADESDFKKAGLGFRSRYMMHAIDYCINNIDLYALKSKTYDEIKQELLEIKGVGNKIADCVALMGYGKLEAFPIDVWIKRALEKIYFNNENKKIQYLQEFAIQKWGKYAGYAQQYLYWNARNNLKNY